MGAATGQHPLSRSTTELTEVQRAYLDTIMAAGDALLQILNDILDLSKIEAGRLELEEVDFDLAVEIQRCVALMEPAAGAQSDTLTIEVDRRLPSLVRGDPVRSSVRSPIAGGGSDLRAQALDPRGRGQQPQQAGDGRHAPAPRA
ncbi:MAG: histidine kinase dimerization/phospho-acceptor domain-containing protein [Nannocystaceae bacterium]